MDLVNKSLIITINKYLFKGFSSRLYFFKYCNKKNMIKRLQSRKKLNRYDKFNSNFYKKVQSGFIKIAKKNKKKYQIINSNLDIENKNKNL